MAERKALIPQITVKGKDDVEQVVKVGALTWGGIKDFIDNVSAVNLPLPNLASSAIGSWLESSQQGISDIDPTDPPDVLAAKIALSQQHSTIGLYRVIADLLSENMQVLYQWVIKHPPIVASLVKGATGLTDEQLDSLSAAQFVRVTRAAWNALVEDGFSEELAGFFGDLLPMTRAPVASEPVSPSQPQIQPIENAGQPAATVDSVNGSKSESEPSPAGA